MTHYETSYAVQTLTKLAAVPLDQNQLLTITCNQMKPHQTRNAITSFEEMHLKTLEYSILRDDAVITLGLL